MTSQHYAVGEVARFAGITVRTLHHYDDIELLRPSVRTPSGHRQYDEDDLARLQQILGYRELGFPLDRIAGILDDPARQRVDHLRAQHALLVERIARLGAQVSAIEKTMEAEDMGIRLSPEERFEVFGDYDPNEHADEAESRWGETDAYRESARRTSSYTKDDWKRMRDEMAEIERQFLAAMRGGGPANGAAATDAAEAHRLNISRWFYDCDHQMHQALGDMYVEDPRFAAHYEALAPGLAVFIRESIIANAAAGAQRSEG
jgi:DNA-binding transcriptional MerR regulator